jgi:AcrR family transcriptional regulator
MSELIRERPFKQISIKAICERTGVSRATFYKHFTDKYDVITWYSKIADGFGLDQVGITLSWFDSYLISTQILLRYRDLIAAFRKSDDRDFLRSRYVRHRTQILVSTLTRRTGVEASERIRFQIEALTLCEVNVVYQWFSRVLDISVKDLASCLESIVPRELYELLKEPIEPADTSGVLHILSILNR